MDSSMDDFSPTPKKRRTGLIVTIIVVLILAAGGYFFFNSRSQTAQKPTPTPAAQPTLEPTEEPTSTPSGTITPGDTTPTVRPTTGEVQDATELNIQVLNGSGTVGVAGEVRDYLSGKGYSNVDTGNADNYDYTNVTINIKSSRKDFLADLQAALEDKYTLADSGTLSADSSYDATVIVGK